jgi:hypothetical protein
MPAGCRDDPILTLDTEQLMSSRTLNQELPSLCDDGDRDR